MTARIPLLGRDGQARGYALVDEADASWLNNFRWFLATTGYAVRNTTVKGKPTMVAMHRVLLGLVPGEVWEADHINGDRLDNRRANLRLATRLLNAANTHGRRGSSKYPSVHWHPKNRKWIVTLSYNNRSKYIGSFADEDEAGAVATRLRAARDRSYLADIEAVA